MEHGGRRGPRPTAAAATEAPLVTPTLAPSNLRARERPSRAGPAAAPPRRRKARPPGLPSLAWQVGSGARVLRPAPERHYRQTRSLRSRYGPPRSRSRSAGGSWPAKGQARVHVGPRRKPPSPELRFGASGPSGRRFRGSVRVLTRTGLWRAVGPGFRRRRRLSSVEPARERAGRACTRACRTRCPGQPHDAHKDDALLCFFIIHASMMRCCASSSSTRV